MVEAVKPVSNFHGTIIGQPATTTKMMIDIAKSLVNCKIVLNTISFHLCPQL